MGGDSMLAPRRGLGRRASLQFGQGNAAQPLRCHVLEGHVTTFRAAGLDGSMVRLDATAFFAGPRETYDRRRPKSRPRRAIRPTLSDGFE